MNDHFSIQCWNSDNSARQMITIKIEIMLVGFILLNTQNDLIEPIAKLKLEHASLSKTPTKLLSSLVACFKSYI